LAGRLPLSLSIYIYRSGGYVHGNIYIYIYIYRSGAQGDRKKEAGQINQSLLTLGTSKRGFRV
jgi:hypothetical protein